MKLNIAVLFGHISTEHDISIITACQAIKNLDQEKYNVIPIYVTKDNKYLTGDSLMTVSNYPENIKGKEVVILPNSNYLYKKTILGLKKYIRIDVGLFCFHGHNGEDGAMQGLFQLNNIPYTSTGILGSVCGANKILFKELLKGMDIPNVPSIWLKDNEYYINRDKLINHIEKKLSYPLIVKPNSLGSSIGITVAKTRTELENALKLAFELDDRVLIEKFLQDFREVNIATIFDGNNHIFSEIEEAIKNEQFLTFNDKYIGGNKKSKRVSNACYLGGNIKAKLTKSETTEIKLYSKKVYDMLDLKGVVRFDYIIAEGHIMLNEINTIPGSLANYLFLKKGFKYSELLDCLINSAILNNSKLNNYTYTFDSSVLKGNHGTKK